MMTKNLFNMNPTEKLNFINTDRAESMKAVWIPGWEYVYAFDPVYNHVRSFKVRTRIISYRRPSKSELPTKVTLFDKNSRQEFTKGQLIYWFHNPDFQFDNIIRRKDVKGGFNIENLKQCNTI